VTPPADEARRAFRGDLRYFAFYAKSQIKPLITTIRDHFHLSETFRREAATTRRWTGPTVSRFHPVAS
jgi:hypothetical protein